MFSFFVIPIFLSNSTTWSPHFVKDVVVIERVQNISLRIKRVCVTNTNKPYTESLSIFKLPTFACRRAYNDLIFLYKIINGL